MRRASKQLVASEGTKLLSPKLRLVGAILSGATVVAHVCSKVPKTPEQVLAASLGAGTFDAEGGSFTIKVPGRAVCLAVVWEGEVVATVPDHMPIDVTEGKAKCGPLDLRSTQ